MTRYCYISCFLFYNVGMKKIVVLLSLLVLLVGCGNDKEEKYESINDLSGKRIGVISGSYHSKYAEENIEDAKVIYLNTFTENIMALKGNKIDCVLIDEPTALIGIRENDGLDYFVIEGSELDTGFIFSQKGTLLDEFNSFVIEARESGLLEELENKWINNDNYLNEKVEIEEYAPIKDTINLIISSENPPYNFVLDGQLAGLNYEIIARFAATYGYELNISDSTFDALLSGVASGKYDVGVDEINITEERKKTIIFSEPVHSSSIGVLFRSNETNNNELAYSQAEELNGKKLGCMSGSIFDLTIKERFPESEIVYFNSRAELLMGLKQGKIEGYLADRPVAMVFCHDNNDIGIIDENIEDCLYGACLSKDATKLKNEFNEFLSEAKQDGFIEKMQEKWFTDNGIEEENEEVNLTGEKGTIKVCTTPDAAPFVFFKDNKYQGYEVDLLNEFAYRNGYKLLIEGISFDALISSVASSKYDIGINGVYISEERARSIDFSDPVYASYGVAVVNKNVNKKVNFFEDIKNKIYRTFIEEDRYKLIIDGILTTLFITAASIVLGTALGFICFLLARRFKGMVKKIIDLIAYVIAGLPVVVILMILFYIIFAKADLSGSLISIIGFGLIVGLSVYSMLNTGVDAIDIGQFEGALALGYTDNQTLFKFILPQAFRIIMPSYRGEIISLIKSSSIVGYVTVQDLTRVSDIIRSRTYDAFFPLIVTAIIYFILAWLLTKIADILQKKYLSNEKTKEEILKSIGQNK